jgi:hypothetical protein
MEPNGDWYDLLSIWELSDTLVPEGEDDPRRFVQLHVGDYVFADPAKLKAFCQRFGIMLSVYDLGIN